jgi:hypothetical protein
MVVGTYRSSEGGRGGGGGVALRSPGISAAVPAAGHNEYLIDSDIISLAEWQMERSGRIRADSGPIATAWPLLAPVFR